MKKGKIREGLTTVALLPYNKNNKPFKSDCNLQYIGFAKTEWKNNDESHQIIHTFLIDLKHVVKTWNKYNHNDDVEKFINQIVEKKMIDFEPPQLSRMLK